MNLAIAVGMMALFVGAFHLMRVVPEAHRAIELSRYALATLSNPKVSDLEKERRARAISASLMGFFLSITLRTGVALVVPWAFLSVLDLSALVSDREVYGLLGSWEAIAGGLAAFTAWHFAARQLRHPQR